MTNVDQNMQCEYTSDAKEILTLKTSEVLKSQLHVRRLTE
jgi:hypothetical protein